MNNEMKNFLADLIMELQEKYNQSLISTDTESLEEKNYRLGMNFSYYDVLEVIESQLKSFGFGVEEINGITPILGEKIIK
ncbi:hypothetical protein CEF21_21435 [Bacillus sp. FJAT-42376]|uniref:hypothetical protein n=1 Tax=Bacillus sp. FJAT-42376 TaxID=2014076 RepID=UPI000F50595B|nr:hypothetical protein [Bacillus sp. FJAT-42376]AZB44645.1 hypothetical protein CEF21_21435 [Bacillus sp. FJAT-42376]